MLHATSMNVEIHNSRIYEVIQIPIMWPFLIEQTNSFNPHGNSKYLFSLFSDVTPNTSIEAPPLISQSCAQSSFMQSDYY